MCCCHHIVIRGKDPFGVHADQLGEDTLADRCVHIIGKLAAEEGWRLSECLEVGIGQPGGIGLDEGDDAVVHRTAPEATLLEHGRDQEFVGDAQFGEMRLDVGFVEALEHPVDHVAAGTEPCRAVEGRELPGEDVAAQRRVHHQAGDGKGDPGRQAHLAIGAQLSARAQLHASQVTTLRRVVEIDHHHPPQQAMTEAFLAGEAAIGHRHQRIVVGQHVDPGEIDFRAARRDMGLECTHGLDRQTGRAQDLQVVEFEVLVRVAQGVEDAFRKAPDRPAGALGFRNEPDIGFVHGKFRGLAEVVVDHHRIGTGYRL